MEKVQKARWTGRYQRQTQRATVSNIPFNTVASVLNTTNVQRQVAGAIDRKNQEFARSVQELTKRTRAHTEAVEDPGDYGVEGTREDGRQGGKNDQQPLPQRTAERVEIEGVDAAPPENTSPEQPGRLDISA